MAGVRGGMTQRFSSIGLLVLVPVALLACSSRTPSVTRVPSPAPSATVEPERAAPAPVSAAEIPDDAVIEIVHFAALSGAEMYTVRIDSDGTVRWHGGEHFVAQPGEASGTADPERFSAVWLELESLMRVRRSELDACTDRAFDAARVVVRVSGGGQRLEFTDESGTCADASASRGLRALLRSVHEMAGTERWIAGTDGELRLG